MRIASSTIAMESTHSFTSSSYMESVVLQGRASEGISQKLADKMGGKGGKSADKAGTKAADLDAVKAGTKENGLAAKTNEKGLTAKEAADSYLKESAAEAAEKQAAAQTKAYEQFIKQMNQGKSQKVGNADDIMSDRYKMKLAALKLLMSSITGKGKLDPKALKDLKSSGVLDLRSDRCKAMASAEAINQQNLSMVAGTTGSGTLWEKVTATDGYYAEAESTTFKSTGLVTTADGRSISFGVEFSMSRSFMAKYSSLSSEQYIQTDPLIINTNSNTADLTDMKFKFDLNSDGTAEEISFANGGGFLALDKNGDGIINDGSELFGTKSGNGFADLAAYDEDGNGWIDENDSVYDQLKVWTKDANGNDHLASLKQADVGAIYLGNTGTEFSLKNDSQATNGTIRRTGIYLKESGGVGTVQHVDLSC